MIEDKNVLGNNQEHDKIHVIDKTVQQNKRARDKHVIIRNQEMASWFTSIYFCCQCLKFIFSLSSKNHQIDKQLNTHNYMIFKPMSKFSKQ